MIPPRRASVPLASSPGLRDQVNRDRTRDHLPLSEGPDRCPQHDPPGSALRPGGLRYSPGGSSLGARSLEPAGHASAANRRGPPPTHGTADHAGHDAEGRHLGVELHDRAALRAHDETRQSAPNAMGFEDHGGLQDRWRCGPDAFSGPYRQRPAGAPSKGVQSRGARSALPEGREAPLTGSPGGRRAGPGGRH